MKKISKLRHSNLEQVKYQMFLLEAYWEFFSFLLCPSTYRSIIYHSSIHHYITCHLSIWACRRQLDGVHFFLPLYEFRDQTQIIRLGSRDLYHLSQLTGPILGILSSHTIFVLFCICIQYDLWFCGMHMCVSESICSHVFVSFLQFVLSDSVLFCFVLFYLILLSFFPCLFSSRER